MKRYSMSVPLLGVRLLILSKDRQAYPPACGADGIQRVDLIRPVKRWQLSAWVGPDVLYPMESLDNKKHRVYK